MKLEWIFKKVMVFLPIIGSSIAAGFFGHFLGSEGIAIMITGQNLVFFAIVIFVLIFGYNIYYKNKTGFPKFFMYLILYVGVYLLYFCFRLYLFFHCL